MLNYKYFNDTIHGQISLSEIAVSILDTPEYQRLRKIKQLGTCNFVFATAVHTRFEHSLGVAFLGKKLLNILMDNQPELNITKNDILKVEIAGLCHDLGHGPWSHVFDNEFINKHERIDEILYKSHEERSIQILRLIVNKHNIGINEDDLNDICEMINPTKNKLSYLYSIINNTNNGIDVDKFDYIARDSYNLNLDFTFNFEKLFSGIRVINNEICFKDKDYYNIYSLFIARFRLHKQVCHHPVVKSIELMIVDYLKLVDKEYDLIDVINNIEHFIRLNDSIFDITHLGFGNTQNIINMNKIINDIESRKIYKHVCDITNKNFNREKIIEVLSEYKLNTEDYKLIYTSIKLGNNEHPFVNIKFYNKTNKNKSFNLDLNEISTKIIKNYSENKYILFINYDKKDMINELKDTF